MTTLDADPAVVRAWVRVNPALARHFEVHQHHIRQVLDRRSHCPGAIGRGCYNADPVGTVEQLRESSPDDGVIVRDDYTDHGEGIKTTIEVPRP
jgi:hypothetical protein